MSSFINIALKDSLGDILGPILRSIWETIHRSILQDVLGNCYHQIQAAHISLPQLYIRVLPNPDHRTWLVCCIANMKQDAKINLSIKAML